MRGVATRSALEEWIERLAATPADGVLPDETVHAVSQLLDALESGAVRAAVREASGRWVAVPWVKRGILLGFRAGSLVEMSPRAGPQPIPPFSFVDRATYPTRAFTVADGVRIVPGGSTIRRGAHVAPGVVCMPPMYINVGAHVGAGTMVDSHALVGSCAQVGQRVHLSAAAQVGGVLEPVNASPVIIEDDVLVGGGCGIYEGTVVRESAVLGSGVVLTRGTPVYDLVHEAIYRGDAETPLEIPPRAVVVPGARAVRGAWAESEGLSLQTPVIVKYRDDRTDTATALERWLR